MNETGHCDCLFCFFLFLFFVHLFNKVRSTVNQTEAPTAAHFSFASHIFHKESMREKKVSFEFSNIIIERRSKLSFINC